MSFTYIPLGKGDIEKILIDAPIDVNFTRRLNFIKNGGYFSFPEGWSVNHDLSEYLFYLPRTIRSTVTEFDMFSSGIFYRIDCPLCSGNASFRGFPKESEARRKEIEAKAAEAIAVNHYYLTFHDPEDLNNLVPETLEKRLPAFIHDNCEYALD